MANIILKKSSVVGKVPTVEDLKFGELALNFADGRLYYKSVDNSIQSFFSTSTTSTLYVNNPTLSVSTTSGALVVAGGVGIGEDLYVGGQLYVNGISVGYGYTGSRGFTGSIGYTGSQGIQGVTGYTGSQGIQGVIGYTGSRGFTGSQGIQGVIGYTGSKGDQGVIGYTGSKGDQGVIGYTGSRGFTGSKGDQGYTGSAGPIAGSNQQFIYNDSGVANGANVYYDESNERVGIGTNTPVQKLEVRGWARFGLAGNDAGIEFEGGYGKVYRATSTGNIIIEPQVNTIFSTGNVGIGTTTPGTLLEISQDNNSTVNLLRLRNSDSLYSQTWDFSLDTSKDLIIAGSSNAGGIVLSPGSRGIEQKTGTNPQTFNIYNTYTDSSNYERGFLKMESNYLKIGVEGAGTGSARSVSLMFGAAEKLRTTLNSVTTVDVVPFSNGTYDLGTSSLKWGELHVNDLYSNTLTLSPTWNDANTVFTGIKLNVTDTASSSTSLLIDLQVDTSSKFNIRKDGRLTINSLISSTSNQFEIQSNGNSQFGGTAVSIGRGGNAIVLFNGAALSWSSSGGVNPGQAIGDTQLWRDSANILAQRNSTNAQTFRIYGTFTDASNYTRGTLSVNTNGDTYLITESAGTGYSFPVVGIRGKGGAQLTISHDNIVRINASGLLELQGRSRITSPSQGVITLSFDSGIADFNRLQFGGTTSSFPSLKRSSTSLQVKLADDSAFTAIKAKTFDLEQVSTTSESTTLSTTTKTQIASFPASSFRSGKLMVQAYNSVTGEVQISEILVVHDGTTASSTEYGVIFTGASSIANYDVDISSSNVRLLATGSTSNSTQYKISEILMIA